MELLTQTKIIDKLYSSNLSLLTISDFRKLFNIEKDNTVYKIVARLNKKGILKKLAKKRYAFTFNMPDDFQIANFLYFPSYISLESALSFYSILSQFPYQITSITSKKTKSLKALDKDFAYFHTKQKLFFGYEKKERFLIAWPEKALLDYFYFCSKGLRSFAPDDFNFKNINSKKFFSLLRKAQDKTLDRFLDKLNLKLC